jgi:hypothetical protein
MGMHGESAVRLTADDAALTARYWETVVAWQTPEPERRLMRAVLKVAILDFKKRYHARDARFRDARDWLFGCEEDGVFAFESVCELLRLSPGKIRTGLLRWMKLKDSQELKVGYTDVSLLRGKKRSLHARVTAV